MKKNHIGIVAAYLAFVTGAFGQSWLVLDMYTRDSTVDPISYVGSYTNEPAGPLSNGVTQGTIGGPLYLEANGEINYGLFRASVRSVMDVPSPPSYASANDATVRGEWNDYIFLPVVPPGSPGDFGTWTVALNVSGTGQAIDDGQPVGLSAAGWALVVGTSQGSVNHGGAWFSDRYQNDPLGTLIIPIPVILGETNFFNVSFELSAQTGYGVFTSNQTLEAKADFSHTIRWLGTVDLVDEQGQSIPGDIISASGTDWTKEITDPAAPPQISIANQASGMIQLTWPDTTVSFNVQTNGDLTNGMWAADTNLMPALTNGTNMVTTSADASHMFYRLVETVTNEVPLLPAAGEIIITEIMYDPLTISDASGEWFEIRNISGGDRNIAGLSFTDGDGGSSSIDPSPDVVLAAGDNYVLARSLDLGLGGDNIANNTFDFSLNNSGDSINIILDAVTIDSVSYDGGVTWPVASGASLSLDPGAYDSIANDLAANWCLATNIYDSTNGNAGTPEMDNSACVAP